MLRLLCAALSNSFAISTDPQMPLFILGYFWAMGTLINKSLCYYSRSLHYSLAIIPLSAHFNVLPIG